MTIASAVAVANLYYNQPMLAAIARTLAVKPHQVGWVSTATQVGYALGMPLFIPLADYLERRRLVVLLLVSVTCALIGAAVARNLPWLVVASFAIGLTTVIAQIMIPFATELATPAEQGNTVGKIMSGILLGILLARTVSGFVAAHFGWRSMFWLAAVTTAAFAILLWRQLPHVPPHSELTYTELLHSIWELVLELPKLRQVSFVAAMFFAAFSAFWTTLVFLLETPPYHYGAQAAGLFGLVGAASAFVAPWAGRTADRRSPRYVVGFALLAVVFSLVEFWVFGFHLWGLVLGVILLDVGVQAAQVANQTRVLGLRPSARNRVNTVYMVSYFLGGSLGSFVGSWSWGRWGWSGVCAASLLLMLLATAAFFFPVRSPAPETQSAPA
jgi:predicted MFS family arabinose efflux permease